MATNDRGFPVELSGAKTSTLLWAREDDIEAQALAQLRNIGELPWVHGLRVMPDVHYGKGATVGSVIAMKGAISPAAVGVDIGCGMQAVKTSLRAEDLPSDLSGLRSAWEKVLPVGFQAHDDVVDVGRLGLGSSIVVNGRLKSWAAFWGEFTSLHDDVQSRLHKAQHQMGTLGGGNHFQELCLDEDGSVWVMLHSGSRNIGNELAQRHMAIARGLDHNQGIVDRDLAVFLDGTPEMTAYRRDLEWAQEYAARSRAVMLALACEALAREFAEANVTFGTPISCHHNYVAQEVIDGQQMLVTRKGAIRAGAGDLGVIPGSMGTDSYIVRGLGNDASFQSASHGAGRRMSRTKARKTFTVEDLRAQTAGVESRKDAGVIDEIPAAYKDINQVVAAQQDLIEVVARLNQVVCVKG